MTSGRLSSREVGKSVNCADMAHIVRVSEGEKDIVFHAVEGDASIDLGQHIRFVAFILHIGEEGFRFQQKRPNGAYRKDTPIALVKQHRSL